MKIKLLSLFSGIGAVETALDNLNIDYELLNYCEINKFASTSYSALHNVDESLNLIDVRHVDGTQFSEVDMLFHGSPCVSFSRIGNHTGGKKGSGTESSLMWETVRIIEECMPKVVVWENVQGVISPRNLDNFNEYIDHLDKLGYQTSFKLINALDVGVGQSRPRMFVVSSLEDLFIFPEIAREGYEPLKSYLEDNPSKRYLMSREAVMSFSRTHENYNHDMSITHPNGYAKCLVAKGAKAVKTNTFLLADLKDYDTLDVPLDDVRGIMRTRKYKIRALSPLEYWRLQSFTDEQFYIAQKALADTYKHGHIRKTEKLLYEQAGNSINIKVLESFLGDVVKQLLTKTN